MIRLTLAEVAELINRPYHWVYNKANLLRHEDDSIKILDIRSIYSIFRLSCLSRGYEFFDYNSIATDKYKDIVRNLRPINKLAEKQELTEQVFYELIFAEKAVKPHIAMFNIIAYLSREFGVSGNYTDKHLIKEHLFKRMNDRIRGNGKTMEDFYNVKILGLSEAQREVYTELRSLVVKDI